MIKHTLILISILFLSACQTLDSSQSLYQRLGEIEGIERITDRFVRLIIKDPRTEAHFKETNLERFYEKQVEHLCNVSDGPCEYTGDDMVTVHKGMNINEAEFNATVEILQQALRENHVSLSVQNQLLERLARMRQEIIYK